jgi:hypothetical protein
MGVTGFAGCSEHGLTVIERLDFTGNSRCGFEGHRSSGYTSGSRSDFADSWLQCITYNSLTTNVIIKSRMVVIVMLAVVMVMAVVMVG